MLYKWKLPGMYPVDANTAGEEISAIYNEKGRCDPADVVERSRPETAPLHSCFEWDDAEAAEKYREEQARGMIRSLSVVVESVPEVEAPVTVRAFHHVEHTYQPISVVVNDADKMKELLQRAMCELDSFKKKYSQLSELKPIFREIDKLAERKTAA